MYDKKTNSFCNRHNPPPFWKP